MQTNEPKLIKLKTFSPFQLLNKVKQIENFEHPMISIKVRNYLKDKSLDIEKLSSPLYVFEVPCYSQKSSKKFARKRPGENLKIKTQKNKLERLFIPFL